MGSSTDRTHSPSIVQYQLIQQLSSTLSQQLNDFFHTATPARMDGYSFYFSVYYKDNKYTINITWMGKGETVDAGQISVNCDAVIDKIYGTDVYNSTLLNDIIIRIKHHGDMCKTKE